MAIRTLGHNDRNKSRDDTSARVGQNEDNETLSAQQPFSIASPKLQQTPMIVGHVFLSTKSEQLKRLWHNREVHDGVRAASLECLFARFAWTIFSPTVFRDFLLMAKEPRVLQVWNEDLARFDIENTEPEKCRLAFNAARSRSESPTKRPRSGRNRDQDKDSCREGLYESTDYDTSSDIDSGYYGELYPLDNREENERGRTRKRKHKESHTDAFKTGVDYRKKRASLNTT